MAGHRCLATSSCHQIDSYINFSFTHTNPFIPLIPLTTMSTISLLRTTLTSESEPLAKRFRALFSLKHLASANPPTPDSDPAVSAIAAAFSSPSALLKHELAYCLGQTRNLHAVPHLQRVLKDKAEDAMCRHEAAEALGALGDRGSLVLLEKLRDDPDEETVVRETCEIAVDRIRWEADHASAEQSSLKKRFVAAPLVTNLTHPVTFPPSTRPLPCPTKKPPPSPPSNPPSSTSPSPSSSATAPCSPSAT
jgi:HEAT repeats